MKTASLPNHPPQGEPASVAQALFVVSSAVGRYKELCEGKYSGEGGWPGQ